MGLTRGVDRWSFCSGFTVPCSQVSGSTDDHAVNEEVGFVQMTGRDLLTAESCAAQSDAWLASRDG
jgi:hypothetical protein